MKVLTITVIMTMFFFLSYTTSKMLWWEKKAHQLEQEKTIILGPVGPMKPFVMNDKTWYYRGYTECTCSNDVK